MSATLKLKVTLGKTETTTPEKPEDEDEEAE